MSRSAVGLHVASTVKKHAAVSHASSTDLVGGYTFRGGRGADPNQQFAELLVERCVVRLGQHLRWRDGCRFSDKLGAGFAVLGGTVGVGSWVQQWTVKVICLD